MGEVKLKPGWFMRDVEKAVVQEKCYCMVRTLSAEQLEKWLAYGKRLQSPGTTEVI